MREREPRLDDDLKTCQAPGCQRLARQKHLCSAHYQRERKRLPMEVPVGELRQRRERVCSVEGCGRRRFSALHCRSHHERAARGELDKPIRQKLRVKPEGLICRMPGCLLKRHRLNLCVGHYRRFHGEVDADTPVRARRANVRYVYGYGMETVIFKAMRTHARRQGVTSIYGALTLVLEEWFQDYARNKDPDFCVFQRDEAPRADGWAQSPDFSPDEE